MATFTSPTFNSQNKWTKFRIKVAEVSSDPENSVSRCRVQVQAWRTDNASIYGGGTANIYIGANTYTQSIPASKTISYKSYTVIFDATVNINRGTYGDAKPNIYCRLSGVVNSDGLATWANVPLTPIIRCALLESVKSFTDEENPQIIYSNPVGSEIVTGIKARICWNSRADGTAYVDMPNDVGGSYTFTLSAADLANMYAASPNSSTLAVEYDLKSTMDGVEYHNYKSANMEIVNADPVIASPTYQDTDATTVAITGSDQTIVQLQSTLRIHSATATPQKGASISEYSLHFNGSVYTPDGSGNVDFPNIDLAGTYEARIAVKDSRGKITTVSVNVPILGWAKPDAVYSLARVNNFEDDTILNVDGKISSVPGSSLFITEKHRALPNGAWSATDTVTDATDKHLNLDKADDWEVLVSVWDAFTVSDPTTYTLTVGKGIPIAYFDIYRRSVSVNGLPDADEQLYVGGTVKADGVTLPHAYSTTEQKIGKWYDGSDLYECTVVLGTTKSLNANSNTVVASWDEPINIVYFNGLRISGGITTAISYVGGFYNGGNIAAVNPRATAQGLDVFVMRYTK